MGTYQSFESWQAQLIEHETNILRLSGVQPEHTRQTFTTIQMEDRPYRIRTIYLRKPSSLSKKTLVMTHGYMSNCTTYATLMAKLIEHYDIVLFDNCGWGLNTRLEHSTGLKDSDAAMGWLKEFICKAIDAFDLPETFLLAGHSAGGLLVSLYATERPRRVESLFLLSPVYMETMDPDDYQPLAYNEQMQPNVLTYPSWIAFSKKVIDRRLSLLYQVYRMPKFIQFLLLRIIGRKYKQKLHQADGL